MTVITLPRKVKAGDTFKITSNVDWELGSFNTYSHVVVSKVDLSTLLYASFNYALGRQTYIVLDVVNIIIDNVQDLDNISKVLMRDRIERAIADNNAGTAIDVEQWERLHQALEEAL